MGDVTHFMEGYFYAMSMFDKFHLTFNIKSKVSGNILKNKNECHLTSTFYSKMSPQFWLTQYFRNTNNLNNQYANLICNKKNLSIECKYPLVSHVSPNVEDDINFKPTKRNLQRASRVSQVRHVMSYVLQILEFAV